MRASSRSRPRRGRADAIKACSTSTLPCMHLIETEGSDLHLKVPSPAAGPPRTASSCRSRAPSRCARRTPSSALFHMLTDDGEARGVRRRARGRLLLLDPGRRALPRQRLPPARLGLDRLPRHPVRRSRPSTELLLPPVISELAEEERGMILLTGTTGSGKSTTLAAMIDHINPDYAQAHRHDRGPDRVPAPRQARRSSTSARSARTPPRSSARCAACCARTRT